MRLSLYLHSKIENMENSGEKKKRNIIMVILRYALISIVVLIAISVSTLIFVDGTLQSKKYLEPWEDTYTNRFEDARLKVIGFGMLAPSAHNMQPWKIVLDEEDLTAFTLYADNTRLLPVSDPFARQTTMSVGAFIENVRIAASKFGYVAYFTLFPKGEYNSSGTPAEMDKFPVARIRLVEGADPYFLCDAITRATPKLKFSGEEISPAEAQSLFNANNDPNNEVLIFSDAKNLTSLKNLSLQGLNIDIKNSAKYGEDRLFRMNERQKNKFRNGPSFEPFGFSKLKMFWMQSMGTLFPVDVETKAEMGVENLKQIILDAPSYLLIRTNGNSRTIQVEAGMLYCRMEHIATYYGFALLPTVQILQEYHEMSKQYKFLHKTHATPGQTIQMLAAIGKIKVNTATHSPRRDVLDLLIKQEDFFVEPEE